MLRGRDRRPAEDQRPESDGRRGQEDGRGQAPRRSREGRTPAGLPPGVIGWQSADCGVPPELQAEARRRHAGVLDGRWQEEARLARRRVVKFGRPGQVGVARGEEAYVRAVRPLLEEGGGGRASPSFRAIPKAWAAAGRPRPADDGPLA